MELDEKSSVVLRNRAPKDNLKIQDAVRESLLTDSTSGIVKGDGDTTSVGSTSFSSPEVEVSNKDLLAVNGKENHKGLDGQCTKVKIDIDNEIKDHVKENDVKEKQKLIKVSEVPKAKIPDGGWGWVVVFSSFVISMIADGISFSFGLLYMEFLEEFKASKATTAWIGSLFIAVPLLSGPVMSALVDRYGCRSMTILGGLISTLGFVLASVSNSIELMMLTFGVIAGLGLGLVYVTAVVSIAYWFEKKRNLAVGLGACGTGVGTFIYAPMTQYFIEEYGWRGTILLLAGTLLNLCVCGCVMRDPDWWILEQKKEKSEKDDEKSTKDDLKSKNSSSASIANSVTYNDNEYSRGKNMKRLISKGVPAEKVIKDEVATIRRREIMVLMKKKNDERKSRSLIDMPTNMSNVVEMNSGFTNTSKECDDGMKYVSFASNIHNRDVAIRKSLEANVITQPLVKNKDEVAENNANVEKTKDDEKSIDDQNKAIRRSMSEAKDLRPLLKQDSKDNRRDWFKKQLSVNHHYLRDLKMPLNSISHRNAILNIKRYKLKASSCPDIFKNSMMTVNEEEENWYDDCVTVLADMFNVELFKEVTFIILCVGTIIIFVWFIVPYFYLAEHMVNNGYSDDDGAVMLSLIGITNTIGMVGLGWIGDFPSVSIGNLYAACLLFCGASVAAIPIVVSNYWLLAFACGTFGLMFAASFTFVPSLLVKLISLDDFTSAYGLVLLAEGIGHLIGPPLSGLIYDLTFSWELSFYLGGGWIIMAGVLTAFIQPIRSYQQRRATERNTEII
ncbi:monocarboxylate transporter 9-like [Zerene cesonia]|uniref:monocarboxylate transporter 9-like n=1 Tax=Zerene cesonia TaxID=33412 RepID=UPI0018E57DB1|nr:monocarboxylate transporter 9-like [Zerene cesonia]XP_038212153.1 monocarboxylate transporter 9-like [Zerene cesonia]